MLNDNNIFISRDDWESLMFHFPSDSPYGIDVFLESMPRINKIQKESGNRISLYSNLNCDAILSALNSNKEVERSQTFRCEITLNQRIIAENAQFTGIAAGQGVGFTTGLLHLRKGLGMRETPIRPHSWHCRMQSDYQYD